MKIDTSDHPVIKSSSFGARRQRRQPVNVGISRETPSRLELPLDMEIHPHPPDLRTLMIELRLKLLLQVHEHRYLLEPSQGQWDNNKPLRAMIGLIQRFCETHINLVWIGHDAG